MSYIEKKTELERNPATVPLLPLGAMMLAGMASLSAMAVDDKAAETAQQLSTVNVEAAVEQPDGYRATATRVGKLLQDPHEIPQAVTTITNSLME